MDKELIERLWNEAARETNALGPRLSRESKFAQLIAEECVQHLMRMHAQAGGRDNYYHCAANELRAKFCAANAEVARR